MRYVKGVQTLDRLPSELMKARATARLAGGRGSELEAHERCVAIVEKMKMKRKQEKYRAPKELVARKMTKPTIAIGAGYM